MRKFKYFIDFDKEEKWLKKMAKQGYQLKEKSFGYKFSLSEPADTTIKIDYRKFKNQADFIDYCTLFEDSGWKHIVGKKNSGTQYFKKIDEEKEEDIFSDSISKAGKYKRLSKMFMETAVSFFPLFVVLLITDTIDIGAIFNPKQLYLTPGLWEMSELSFWKAFIFETPFALMRGISWLLLPVSSILCLFFAYKAQKLFENGKTQ
ncbi:DUF2812 domain-containing protein [Bacillus sp. CGMCC 1.16607]|uniref:DUF2812 domain-containing protein n=1 Tax=Bacillus sp. CGMCC 1.16607 TaxID=3351842 RepID=UPI00363EA78C